MTHRQDGAAATPGPLHIRPATRRTGRPELVDERPAPTRHQSPSSRCCTLQELPPQLLYQDRAVAATRCGPRRNFGYHIQGRLVLSQVSLACRCACRPPHQCHPYQVVWEGKQGLCLAPLPLRRRRRLEWHKRDRGSATPAHVYVPLHCARMLSQGTD
jgi:hypothetical protein